MELGCMPKQQAQCRVLKYALIEENILSSFATQYFYEKKLFQAAHEYDQISKKEFWKAFMPIFKRHLSEVSENFQRQLHF